MPAFAAPVVPDAPRVTEHRERTRAQWYEVPFGRGTVAFRLPDGVDGTVAASRVGAGRCPIRSPRPRTAIRTPIGAPPLRELARGKRTACIAVTDATRDCPDHLLVPPMLEELSAAGVPDDGDHDPGRGRHAPGEHRRRKTATNWATRSSIATGWSTTTRPMPATWSRSRTGRAAFPSCSTALAVEADLLLATGRVEPHQYAGFSGGGKTVAIGCAGEAIIAYTHGPAMLDLPGTRLAQLGGQPVPGGGAARSRGRPNVAFVGNVVLDDDERRRRDRVRRAGGRPGSPRRPSPSSMYTVPIPEQVDIAVAGRRLPEGRKSLPGEPGRQLPPVRADAGRAPGRRDHRSRPPVRREPAKARENDASSRRCRNRADRGDHRQGAGERHPAGRATGLRHGARAAGRDRDRRRCEDPERRPPVGFVPAADIDEALATGRRDRSACPRRRLSCRTRCLTLADRRRGVHAAG